MMDELGQEGQGALCKHLLSDCRVKPAAVSVVLDLQFDVVKQDWFVNEVCERTTSEESQVRSFQLSKRGCFLI
jgi:hypothetical protein